MAETDTTTSQSEAADTVAVDLTPTADAAAPDAQADAPDAPTPADDDGADDSALGGKLPDGDKPANDEPAAPVVPEAYALTAPEGMALDGELVEEVTPIFKELGLTNEQADKLTPIAGKLVAKATEAVQSAMIDGAMAQRKEWLDHAKAADDIGGGKWDATLHTAARGLDALGYTEGTPFRAFLTETGIGNHPDMIRIAAKLGELAGEDGDFVRADAGAKVEETREQRWYGTKG